VAHRSAGDADNLDPVLAEDIGKYATITGGIDFHIGTASLPYLYRGSKSQGHLAVLRRVLPGANHNKNC